MYMPVNSLLRCMRFDNLELRDASSFNLCTKPPNLSQGSLVSLSCSFLGLLGESVKELCQPQLSRKLVSTESCSVLNSSCLFTSLSRWIQTCSNAIACHVAGY